MTIGWVIVSPHIKLLEKERDLTVLNVPFLTVLNQTFLQQHDLFVGEVYETQIRLLNGSYPQTRIMLICSIDPYSSQKLDTTALHSVVPLETPHFFSTPGAIDNPKEALTLTYRLKNV